jgi:hypothetical protein
VRPAGFPDLRSLERMYRWVAFGDDFGEVSLVELSRTELATKNPRLRRRTLASYSAKIDGLMAGLLDACASNLSKNPSDPAVSSWSMSQRNRTLSGISPVGVVVRSSD